VLLVGMALLVVGCIPAAPAPPAAPPAKKPGTLLQPGAANPYGPSGKGEFLASCALTKRATEDPIVAPGSTTFWHQHDFFGNTTIGPDSTVDTLLGQGSTCVTAFDTAAYWMPTLLHDGVSTTPYFANFFYRVNYPQDPAKVQPFPTGLNVVAGSAGATSPQPDYIVRWGCGGSSTTSATIPSCGGANLVFELRFPECWDGQHLDFPDHKSHMTYARGASCPPAYPVLVPQLVFHVEWILPAGGVNTVTSDHTMGGTDVTPGLTAHGDFINAWSPEALKQRVTACLRAAVLCDKDGVIIGS
jgi:Domain of unknown function (DUF1996)